MKSYWKWLRVGVAVGLIVAMPMTGRADNAFAETIFRTATLDGYAIGQRASGAYSLRASADGQPVTATFFLTNTQNNERSSVVANCIGGATTRELTGICVKEIDTLAMTNGTYLIVARVTYADGTSIVSNQISVDFPVAVEVQEESSPIIDTRPARRAPETVAKIKTAWGQILDKIRYQNNTAEQQSTLAVPLIREMRDVWVNARGGERDATEAAHRLDVLQADLREGVDVTSPLVRSKTRYQSAKEFGTTIDRRIMEIVSISISTTTANVIVSATTTSEKGQQVVRQERKRVVTEKLQLNGRALPNMYVTIYVYSGALKIGVVKAGLNRSWVYEFNDSIADGSHEAYATVNEQTGKVIAKSPRLGFIKKGDMIMIEQVIAEDIAAVPEESIESTQTAKRSYWLPALAIMGMVLLIGIFFAARSIINRRRNFI